ncbi:MAG: glycosyltransferase family 4 protein [Immundisolibacteraceae bacterium]|nr:glycosyltransferase family 4 protein [Immundisolibacteraceae bacterium]
MKIIHFIDTKGVGGAETVMMECVKQLRDLRHDVEVWHLNSDWLASACQDAGITHRVPWWPSAYKKAYLLPFFLVLLLVQLYLHRVRVIHSHIYSAVVSIGIISPLTPAVHVGTLHDTWFLSKRTRWRRFLLRWIIRVGSKIAVISNDMRNFVSQGLNLPPETFFVVYNGTDTQRFYPADREALEANQTVRLLCVARLIPRKRIDLLIAATGELIGQGYRVTTQVVGGGELAASLGNTIVESGLDDHVFLLGEHNDIPQLLRQADVFVLPSDNEGLPCSIIEGMACGLPIVAADVGGIRELVKPDINGALFPAGELAKLVEALKPVIDHGEKRKSFGIASRAMVDQKFAARVMCEHYLDIYTHASTPI